MQVNMASYFFVGMFFVTAVPHFVNGIIGKFFQTPFAKPSGKGLSSLTVNFSGASLIVWSPMRSCCSLDSLIFDRFSAPGRSQLGYSSPALCWGGISVRFTEAILRSGSHM